MICKPWVETCQKQAMRFPLPTPFHLCNAQPVPLLSNVHRPFTRTMVPTGKRHGCHIETFAGRRRYQKIRVQISTTNCYMCSALWGGINAFGFGEAAITENAVNG